MRLWQTHVQPQLDAPEVEISSDPVEAEAAQMAQLKAQLAAVNSMLALQVLFIHQYVSMTVWSSSLFGGASLPPISLLHISRFLFFSPCRTWIPHSDTPRATAEFDCHESNFNSRKWSRGVVRLNWWKTSTEQKRFMYWAGEKKGAGEEDGAASVAVTHSS